MTNFHAELLTPAGMADVRDAAVGAYAWFTHAGTIDQFDAIQKDGLKPTWPHAHMTPDEVTAAFGDVGKNILCLSPYPKTIPLMLNKGGKSVFKLGLPADKLPARVGVDWSFGGTWNLTTENRQSVNGATRGQVFLSVLKRREVIVSYDGIPAADLKVCTEAVRDKPPSEWPELIDVDFKDVAIFAPDLCGNIPL
jgi:hypothetical protein